MQFNGRLTDLEELLLRCRIPQSKAFLAEAIACYQAGAHRSAIISTWIAVVFDIIGKFKELALEGDPQAQKAIDDLEQRHLENNIVESLNFERNILEQARKDFQFISPSEQEDLQRLFADRNRCAHPSLRSLEVHCLRKIFLYQALSFFSSRLLFPLVRRYKRAGDLWPNQPSSVAFLTEGRRSGGKQMCICRMPFVGIPTLSLRKYKFYDTAC